MAEFREIWSFSSVSTLKRLDSECEEEIRSEGDGDLVLGELLPEHSRLSEKHCWCNKYLVGASKDGMHVNFSDTCDMIEPFLKK